MTEHYEGASHSHNFLEVKFEGMDDMIKELRKMADNEMNEILFQVGRKYTRLIKESAKNRVPVDTGRLKKAIRLSNSRKKMNFKVYVSEAKKTGAYYGYYVEYGYKDTNPREYSVTPFMTPAGEEYEKEFEREMKSELHKALYKVGN
ncbi:MAG: HK97 gp10 family phage protein [Synergistales bacterium]|nr:HK97 gp10 family phage protein [Synergistales bacterium]